MTLRSSTRDRLRVLFIVVVVLGGLAVFLWTRVRRSQIQSVATTSEVIKAPEPLGSSAASPSFSPTDSPSPEIAVTPATEPGLTPNSTPNDGQPEASYVGKLNLIIPVAGVRSDQLLDTFTDARSEGRSHDAIDIPAPAGTPVLAVSDGQVVKLFQSERGGTTIYQLSPDKKLVFYYAHVQGYAGGVVVDKLLRQGEVIGYVGDTGNAGTGNFHLHFGVSRMVVEDGWWKGLPVNPYPLLAGTGTGG